MIDSSLVRVFMYYSTVLEYSSGNKTIILGIHSLVIRYPDREFVSTMVNLKKILVKERFIQAKIPCSISFQYVFKSIRSQFIDDLHASDIWGAYTEPYITFIFYIFLYFTFPSFWDLCSSQIYHLISLTAIVKLLTNEQGYYRYFEH